ncbi:hypothetical protein EG68_08427 [Paragonimus skrjabini miyazakii]|uniref:Phosphatidylinositol-4,5-bisphosphate 4-phosphatase n=1 Tax=Paragonimus skrjabini miyazakii TaxID=59628 RepID=A0A8S9YQF0_9TREM|nr:hypothetical protein EG68_08427 [Paragonimus skrjabini miyazakii]
MCAVKSSFHSVKPILTDGRKSASVDDLRTKGYVVPYSCRPPVASISKNLGRLIFCQVCGHIIEIPLSYSRLVVLCSNCRESTPARPPPSDRRFFRCCCGRLILVPVYVRSVICPRPGCRQLLLLPAATAMEYSELTRNQSVQTQSPSESRGDLELEIGPSQKHDTTEGTRPIELRCGFCYYRFFAPNSFGLTSDAKCPHCKHVTSVGPDFARIRALRLLEYALVALAVAIVTSVVTYVYRERTGGLYSVNLGLGFAGLVMVLKAVAYYRMPVSRIVIGGYEM